MALRLPRLPDFGRWSIAAWTRGLFAFWGVGLLTAALAAGAAPELGLLRRQADQVRRDYQALQSKLREMSRVQAKRGSRFSSLDSRRLAMQLRQARERGDTREADSLQRELGLRELSSSTGREESLDEQRSRLEARLAPKERIAGALRWSRRIAATVATMCLFAGLRIVVLGGLPIQAPDPALQGWRRGLDGLGRVALGAAWAWIPGLAGFLFAGMAIAPGFSESNPWIPWLVAAGLATILGGFFAPQDVAALFAGPDWAGPRFWACLRRHFGPVRLAPDVSTAFLPDPRAFLRPLQRAFVVFCFGYALVIAGFRGLEHWQASAGLALCAAGLLLCGFRLPRLAPIPGGVSPRPWPEWARRSFYCLAGAGLLVAALHKSVPRLEELRETFLESKSRLDKAEARAARLQKIEEEQLKLNKAYQERLAQLPADHRAALEKALQGGPLSGREIYAPQVGEVLRLSDRLRIAAIELKECRYNLGLLPLFREESAAVRDEARRRERRLWVIYWVAAGLAALAFAASVLCARAHAAGLGPDLGPGIAAWALGQRWACLMLAGHGPLVLDNDSKPAFLFCAALMSAAALWGFWRLARIFWSWKTSPSPLLPAGGAGAEGLPASAPDLSSLRRPLARAFAVFWLADALLAALALGGLETAWPVAVCGAALLVLAGILSSAPRSAGEAEPAAGWARMTRRPWPYWAVRSFSALAVAGLAYAPFAALGGRYFELQSLLEETESRMAQVKSWAARRPQLERELTQLYALSLEEEKTVSREEISAAEKLLAGKRSLDGLEPRIAGAIKTRQALWSGRRDLERAFASIAELKRLEEQSQAVSAELRVRGRIRRVLAWLAAGAAALSLAASALWVKARRAGLGPDLGAGVTLPPLILLRWTCCMLAVFGNQAAALFALALLGVSPALGLLQAWGRNPGAREWLRDLLPPLPEDVFAKAKAKAVSGLAQAELPLLNRYLLAAVRQGHPLAGAVAAYSSTIKTAWLRDALGAAARELESGVPLASALGNAETVAGRALCPPAYLAALRAGETAGDLRAGLDLAGESLSESARFELTAKASLNYVVIMGGLVATIAGFLLIFVVPTFKTIFESFGAELPALTRFVLGLSDIFVRYWFLPPLALWRLVVLGRRHGGQAALRGLIPGARKLYQKFEEIPLCHGLAGLLKAGCPTEKALEILAGRPAEGPVHPLRRAAERVRGGEALSAGLSQAGGFSQELLWACALGEQRGDLPATLSWLARHQRLCARAQMERLLPWIERGANVALALVMAVVVIGMFIPMFSLGTLAE